MEERLLLAMRQDAICRTGALSSLAAEFVHESTSAISWALGVRRDAAHSRRLEAQKGPK
jgi:hypothetical protein